MSVYALTPLAKADIFDIWSCIGVDSEEIANRVEQAIYDGCAFVAEAPTRGHSAPISPAAPFVSGRLPVFTTPPLSTRPGSSPAAPFVSGRLPVIPTTPLSTGPRRLPFRLSPFCTGREIYGAYLNG